MKLIYLEYRNLKKLNYIIQFMNTKLHGVINTVTGTKIHIEKLHMEKYEIKPTSKIFSLKKIQKTS